MTRFLLHYGIHFLLPVVVGWFLFRDNRLMAILILLAGILIDIDHLLANPVFDQQRCSIGFHPLHTYLATAVYCLLFIVPKTRIFGLALLIHILADTTDCCLLFLESE